MSLQSLERHEEAGTLDMPDECEVCGEEFTFGGWRVHHGWAACGACGATYCILDYDDDENYNGAELKYDETFAEAIGAFYDEYGTRWDMDDRFDEFVEENYPELNDG